MEICQACRHGNPDGYAYCGNCGRQPGSEPSVVDDLDDVAAASEPTRYLCAAAHLDRKLAVTMVGQVLEEPLRAVAMSPGVDLVAVAKYAMAARDRHAVHDLFQAGFLILLFAAFVTANGSMALLALVGSWLTVCLEIGVARWGTLGTSLRSGTFSPARAPKPTTVRANRQLEHLRAYDGGNVTVYQGFRPFMGYGRSTDSWSLLLDTTRPLARDEPIATFTVAELNTRLQKQITQLNVPKMRVRNRLYIGGDDIHHDRRFLAHPLARPVAQVEDTVLTALLANPEDRARPYLTVEILGWQGEIAWSGFVRLVLDDTTLFVETTYCALPPLQLSFYDVDDQLIPPTFGQFLRFTGSCAARVPRALFRCVPDGGRQALTEFRLWLKAKRHQRAVNTTFTVNHGALVSIREAATDLRLDTTRTPRGFHRHFQLVDHRRHSQMVDKRIFQTLAEFLQEKNIDPAELVVRAEQIVNNSVTIGGNATLVNSAIGGAGATNSVVDLVRNIRRKDD